MSTSHQSLRDTYEVFTPDLDHLIALLKEKPFVFEAKLTGDCFGARVWRWLKPAPGSRSRTCIGRIQCTAATAEDNCIVTHAC